MNPIKISLRYIAHICLVPVVAVLGAVAHFFQHMHDEVEKI